MSRLKNQKKSGFTLIELMIVVGIIAIIAGIVFVATDPVKNFAQTSNAKRWLEIGSIASAIKQFQVDNRGSSPAGFDGNLKMIGLATDGCSVDCGSTSDIFYFNPSETLNYYSNNTYTVRHWFDVTGFSDFSFLTVSLVLDCDGNCNGQTRIRIGNSASYSDYDFVNASLVRTDGSPTNYSWYTATFPANKSSLGNLFYVQLLKYTGSGTIRFLMDEGGPAGVYPEFRTDSNGDGNHSGWTRDNGDYFFKIGLPGKTADTCLNLGADLVGPYFKEMPLDPKSGSQERTYYAVMQTATGGVKVVACQPENSEEISVTR
ncbi:MAG: prepilin-type N-terminal cleavage/methylation domain-containing protein [Candidatus Buchananbacteria bacterium]